MSDPELRRIIEDGTEKDPETGCWTWTGKTVKDRNGTDYPVLRKYKERRSARVAYEEYNGPVPYGERVVRSCGNTLCLAPEHIIAVTYAEERRLKKAWLGTEVVLQVDIRADGTACAYALNKEAVRRMRRIRGALELENEEFELPPGTVRFIGLRSHETIHQYVKNARERLGDAGDGYEARRRVTARGWTEFKREEEEHLGIASDLDIG